MTIKAYALTRIHRKNADGSPNHVLAKTVFDTTLKEYERLDPLGAVRRATAEEIAIDNAQRRAENGGVPVSDDETVTEEPKQKVTPKKAADKGTETKKPASGAKGDPDASTDKKADTDADAGKDAGNGSGAGADDDI